MAAKQRILSVDVLRGLTVAMMIIVNNPAVWGSVYAPLSHAEWHGMTPTDLVFPFFIFIIGVSAAFSLGGRKASGGKDMILHIFKRSLMIFLIGALLESAGALLFGRFSWGGFRLMGVLQAIAVTYFFGSLLLMALKFRYLLLTSSVILGLWWVAQLLWNGFEMSPDNFIVMFDKAVIGEAHMYRDWLPDGSAVIAFEPESLLTNVSRIAQLLLGAYVGGVLVDREKTDPEKLNMILLAGAVMLLVGFMIQYGCPINKKVWTSSYVLVSSGFATLLLGVFFWLIDIRGDKSWTGFFRVFGVNPLFLYIVASCIGCVLLAPIVGGSMSPGEYVHSTVLEPLLGAKFGNLVYSLLLVALVWLIGYTLDRRKIYIKL